MEDLREPQTSVSDKRPGLVQIHLAVLLFGFSGVLGKSIDAGPVMITFGRTALAAAALLIGMLSAGVGLSIKKPRDFAALLFSGMLLTLHWYTFFESIRVSSVAVGLITFSTFPIFVTFLEPHFFGERLRRSDIRAALAVVIGIVLVVPSLDFGNNVTRGVVWGVLSGFSFAILSLLNRTHVRFYSPITVTFYQLAFATLFSLPVVVMAGELPSKEGLLLLLVLGVVCTALAHGLFIASLKHVKAKTAGIVSCLEPVYGIALAVILTGELPALRTIIGGLIILGSVCFSTMQEKPDGRKGGVRHSEGREPK